MRKQVLWLVFSEIPEQPRVLQEMTAKRKHQRLVKAETASKLAKKDVRK